MIRELKIRIFLTGNPGVGKTTLVRKIVGQLEGIKAAGFYTQETRRCGQRTGFKIVTLDGQSATLASLRGTGPRAGKYSVHVDEFEKVALRDLDPTAMPADLYVIDEIGKMELLSDQFKRKLTDLLARPTNLLATIAKRGTGFVDQIKRRSDIELIEVTRENRDELPHELTARIKIDLGKRG
ncbi:MAG TPA: NTPase [Candidatus Binatia bacterium]